MSLNLPYIELHSIIMFWLYMNLPYIELQFVIMSMPFTSVPFGSGISFTHYHNHAVFCGPTQQHYLTIFVCALHAVFFV